MPTAFSSLALSPPLLTVLEELGFTEPTPIQEASVPILLTGKDLVGQSKTGSGKTVAFGLPILERLELDQLQVQALVLCPTRELAAQVARELRKIGRRHAGFQVRTLSGGEPMRDQVGALRRGVHVVVGTPGRVLDHLKRERLDLSHLKTIVLDEADRMLEMGFQADIEKVIEAAPKERQTVFFSATFPHSIAAMSRQYQKNAQRVTVEDTEANQPIRQLFLPAAQDEKLLALTWALGNFAYESVLIFCNFKASVKEVARHLHLQGASVDNLHGDLEQYDRDEVMALFRSQCARILVATDVAARGIDVSDLDLVINFELPNQDEIYTHRIGRTGRAGKEGIALALVDERELSRLREQAGPALTKAERTSNVGDEARLKRPPLMQMLKIAGGRKDKVRPGDILGALTGEAGGLNASDIGKIEIHDRRAYVAVATEFAEEALKSLNNGRIKGRRFRVTRV